MKKLFAVAALVLSSVGAFAQHSVGTVTIQPKVGLNIANLTDVDDSKTRPGVAVGAELEYQATPMFGISAGLLYSMQGCKYNGAGDIMGLDVDGEATAKMDYINIPILANIYVAKGLAIKAGIQPGFNVNSKISGKAEIAGINLSTKDYDLDGVKSVDFSIPVGASYEYENFVIDARYNIGITKVIDYSDCKNSVFQLTIGYKFAL